MRFHQLLLPSVLTLAACGDSIEKSSDDTHGGGNGDGADSGTADTQDAGTDDAGSATVTTGPIAPDCTEELGWCAQGEASAKLACKNVDGDPYEITTQLSGKQLYVACQVLADSLGNPTGDLALEIGPPQDHPLYGAHWIEFVLTNYTGGGTYELESWGASGLQGISVQGSSSSVLVSGNDEEAVGVANGCAPSKCTALVAPESEPVPHDDQVHEFRLRVQIQCEADGNLWSHPNCEENDLCTYVSPPTAQLDVQCSN